MPETGHGTRRLIPPIQMPSGIDIPVHPDTPTGRPEKFILEKVQIGCQQEISGDLVRKVEGDGDERIRIFYNQMVDRLVAQIKTFIMGEKAHEETRTVVFEYPASWWQHFKQEVFPRWLLKRYPVRRQRHQRLVIFKQVEVLPKFNRFLKPEEQELHFPVLSAEVSPQHPCPQPPRT